LIIIKRINWKEAVDEVKTIQTVEITNVNIVTKRTSATPHYILTQNKNTPLVQTANKEHLQHQVEVVDDQERM